MKKTPELLIKKFLANELNSEEALQLKEWMQIPENRNFLKKEVQINHLLIDYFQEFDAEKAYKETEPVIRKSSKAHQLPLRKYWKYAAVAAILVIALASTYFLRDSTFNNQIENTPPIIVNNKIEMGTDKAILTLEDGSIVILEKGTTYQAKNANSNGEQIIYDDMSNNAAGEIAYNYLTIPRGGEFFVQLSDGTKVWLNSESQLKYPVAFIDGKTRQVELIYGEAYFEVSPSTTHNGATFKVFNKAQEIEVLGTEFNIKAYKDETNMYTTLVEGKVAVSYEGKKQNLTPNQQSNVNLLKNSLTVSAVNVSYEISWKVGVFNFERKSLKDIMKVLSRWYNMDVIFENKNLENARFNGLINRRYPIKDILSVLQSSNIINTYEINDNTLILR
jgi:ferric-dicitrate binding protein FerR (iron transport regulator)